MSAWDRFFGKLELADLEEQRKNAIGWTVMTVDTSGEEWSIPFAHGLHETPEDALLAKIRMEESDKKWEDEGWRHFVVPVLPT